MERLLEEEEEEEGEEEEEEEESSLRRPGRGSCSRRRSRAILTTGVIGGEVGEDFATFCQSGDGIFVRDGEAARRCCGISWLSSSISSALSFGGSGL